MIDWTPLIIAGAAFVSACAAAIPTIVVIFQHSRTRAVVADNSKTLSRVEAQTNGTLEASRAATVSLRAEVVGHEARLAALEAAAKAQVGAKP